MNKAISTTIILLLLTGSITVGLVTYKVYQTYQTTQTVSTSIECINKRLDYCTYWRNVNYASEPYWDQNCGDKPTFDVCNNILGGGATTSESTTSTTSTTTTTTTIPIALSKPALQKFKKQPGVMLGVDSDLVYELSQEGFIWKDTSTGKVYTNVYKLFHDKGVDWVRVQLFWYDTLGDYNLMNVTNILRSANDAGLNVAVVLSLADNWGDIGSHCINYNPITLPKYIDLSCPDGCCRLDDLNEVDKKTVLKEYARNVSKYFEDNGIDVKLYEIGYELGIPGFLRYAMAKFIEGPPKKWECPDTYLHFTNMIIDNNDCDTEYWTQCKCCADENYNDICDYNEVEGDENIEWHKNNIWDRYEADVINDVITEIKKSNPDALIQSHVDTGEQWREWVYEYFKTLLDKGVSIDYAALSYYPSAIHEYYPYQEVHQNLGYLLSKVDWIHQQLLNDGYDIKFMIAEFAYPSDPNLDQWFLERHFDNEIKPFHWDDYDDVTRNWLKNDYCPKCQETEGYSLTLEDQARWLNDFYDTIYSDANISGSFWLWPEAIEWGNTFCGLFYPPSVEPECTKDFVMGAITFSFYDSGKMSTLKNNCFNWLKIGVSESLLAYDSDGNGKRDVIDWLDLAKYASGWDKNYDLLLGFVENYKDREDDLYTLTKEAVQDIVNNGYEIGIYEIGNELDMEFAGLNPWEPPYNIPDLNPDNWQEYWDDLAPILKAAIRGIRETDPDAKILLHLAHSHEYDFVDAFISNMTSRGVYFDYVGLTTPADFSFICDTSTLEVTAKKIGNHGKKAIIVEWAYPNDIDAAYTLNCLFDWVLDSETAASRGYPYTNVGQAACIRDELQYFYNNPNILGGMYGFPLDENAHEGLCIERCEGRTDCNKPLVLKEPALNEIKSFMSS